MWLHKYICTAFRQYSFFISIFGRTILPIFDIISVSRAFVVKEMWYDPDFKWAMWSVTMTAKQSAN